MMDASRVLLCMVFSSGILDKVYFSALIAVFGIGFVKLAILFLSLAGAGAL